MYRATGGNNVVGVVAKRPMLLLDFAIYMYIYPAALCDV